MCMWFFAGWGGDFESIGMKIELRKNYLWKIGIKIELRKRYLRKELLKKAKHIIGP